MKCRTILSLAIVVNFCAAWAWEYTDSVCVYFPKSGDKINTELYDNGKALKEFAARMDSAMACDSLPTVIKSIRISGAASPEGLSSYNDKLSRRRAESLAEWISSLSLCADSLIQISSIGADWEGLTEKLHTDSAFSGRSEMAEAVKRIDAAGSGHGSTRQLWQILPRNVYNYLQKNTFPPLRIARADVIWERVTVPSQPSVDIANDRALTDSTSTVDQSSDMTVVTDTVAIAPYVPVMDYGDGSGRGKMFPFAITTNLLYDAAMIPNLGITVPLGRKWSVEASWMYAWWSRNVRHRYWRVYGGELGVRRWFGSRNRQLLSGHHVGVYGEMLTYDFEFGGKGYQGGRWTWGAGVSYGYSLPVSSRINIDFTIGFGYLGGEYKKYHPADGCYVWDSTHRLNWFGPTKAEVSLVWYIGSLKQRKGGER